MAERWLLHDSARTLTKKFNAAVDELNQVIKSQTLTEQTPIEINDLSEEEVQQILTNKGGVSND